ncbi:hypothetical protein CALVIDRAFT_601488 [Calocera viscosa TUFC12733]|uniref:Uncharacterized protein n=1 Tax=Calocera viscosa (strain TUFC12733) TaxID=1330018 RepID=A0A167IC30_CALVF|nr:hypothetical protein CALVIDRAFT_601488 [Calocera viscosa TUFC12733]
MVGRMILALATVALYTACLVQGLSIGEQQTNAWRLARGLNPLKPKKFFDATRTGPHLPRQSITGPVPILGYVAVTPGDGSVVCFVADAGCSPGDTTETDGTTFTFDPNYAGLQPITSVDLLPTWQLAIQKNSDPVGHFDGSPGSIDAGPIVILGTHETPGTWASPSEGGIWQTDSGFLVATWTNEDGSQVTLGPAFLQDPYYGELYAAADLDAYNQYQYSDGGADDGYLYNTVYLVFVPA